MGEQRTKKKSLVSASKQQILTCAHPSPYSEKGFFGCKHFSKVNSYLIQNSLDPINWQLPTLEEVRNKQLSIVTPAKQDKEKETIKQVSEPQTVPSKKRTQPDDEAEQEEEEEDTDLDYKGIKRTNDFDEELEKPLKKPKIYEED